MKKFFAALLGISFVFAALFMVGGEALAKEKSYVWKISHIRPADTAIERLSRGQFDSDIAKQDDYSFIDYDLLLSTIRLNIT